MSERLLREFGTRAEGLIDVPDFRELDRRGNRRRQGLVAAVASVVSVVLAVTGILATQEPPRSDDPVAPPPEVTEPYPGNIMGTLDKGTYELELSSDPEVPVARFTVPDGWNAWEGPNRFDTIGDYPTNDEALGHASWYAGLLVLEVQYVAARPCDSAYVWEQDSAALVRAITHAPRLKVTAKAEHGARFGHPAVHLRVRETRAPKGCRDDFLFETVGSGFLSYLEPGTSHDGWVVDVDGQPILVWTAWTPGTPQKEVRDLLTIVDSIEFD